MPLVLFATRIILVRTIAMIVISIVSIVIYPKEPLHANEAK